MTSGWLKVKPAAVYAGVSVRTFRGYLVAGLRHVRMPSGAILTRREFVDEFYFRFEAADQAASLDRAVDAVAKDLGISARR